MAGFRVSGMALMLFPCLRFMSSCILKIWSTVRPFAPDEPAVPRWGEEGGPVTAGTTTRGSVKEELSLPVKIPKLHVLLVVGGLRHTGVHPRGQLGARDDAIAVAVGMPLQTIQELAREDAVATAPRVTSWFLRPAVSTWMTRLRASSVQIAPGRARGGAWRPHQTVAAIAGVDGHQDMFALGCAGPSA